jgi:hypothetical protein
LESSSSNRNRNGNYNSNGNYAARILTNKYESLLLEAELLMKRSFLFAAELFD